MIEETLLEAEAKMDQAVGHLQTQFATVRTGRANPALLHRIMVDYYGSPTPLQQLASFSVPEARLLLVHPYDRSSIGVIERAILASDLGLNPSNDGTVTVTMPSGAQRVFQPDSRGPRKTTITASSTSTAASVASQPITRNTTRAALSTTVPSLLPVPLLPVAGERTHPTDHRSFLRLDAPAYPRRRCTPEFPREA